MPRTRLSGGWNGEVPMFVVNLSDEEYFLYHSYGTVRNGTADRIVCPAHAYCFLENGGSAEEFANYTVETDFSQLPEDSLAHQYKWRSAVIVKEDTNEIPV